MGGLPGPLFVFASLRKMVGVSRSLPPASLIYNPKAGRRRHGRTIERIKTALGSTYDLAITPTAGPRHAIDLARAASSRGDVAVFAWGGDGTVREVVEGILGSTTHLGVLPGGTFNVVARSIGLSGDPVRAARLLTRAVPRPRDVGLIADTPFVMQATAGLDGFLMHHLRPDLKARLGIGGAVVDGLRALVRYRFPRFRVSVDGAEHEVTGAGFVNMTEYAGRYHFVPGARWDDGKAHALLYTGRTRLTAVGFAIDIALGRHHLRRDVVIKEARTMTIMKSPEVHVQTDGDAWRGDLPATCRLAVQPIQVLIPA